MVIYYNFHPYRKKKISSEINFILLKQHISWVIFLELQFLAEGSKYFSCIYFAFV